MKNLIKVKFKSKAKPKKDCGPVLLDCPPKSPAQKAIDEAFESLMNDEIHPLNEDEIEHINKRIAWLQSEIANYRTRKAELQLKAKKDSASKLIKKSMSEQKTKSEKSES